MTGVYWTDNELYSLQWVDKRGQTRRTDNKI